METIKINKGNQYDPDGYRIMSQEDGRSTVTYAYGSIGKRGDGTIGLTRDGRWFLGVDYEDYEDEVDQACKDTMSDGNERIIQLISDADKNPQPQYPRTVDPCPKCHTYCCGDCDC